jgi:hypothetical protein
MTISLECPTFSQKPIKYVSANLLLTIKEKIRPRHMAKAANFICRKVSFMRGKVSRPASGTAFLYNCGRIPYRVFRSTNSTMGIGVPRTSHISWSSCHHTKQMTLASTSACAVSTQSVRSRSKLCRDSSPISPSHGHWGRQRSEGFPVSHPSASALACSR